MSLIFLLLLVAGVSFFSIRLINSVQLGSLLHGSNFGIGSFIVYPMAFIVFFNVFWFAIGIDFYSLKKWNVYASEESFINVVMLHLAFLAMFSVSYKINGMGSKTKYYIRSYVSDGHSRAADVKNYLIVSIYLFVFFLFFRETVSGLLYNQIWNVQVKILNIIVVLSIYYLFGGYSWKRFSVMSAVFVVLIGVLLFIVTASRGFIMVYLSLLLFYDMFRFPDERVRHRFYLLVFFGGAFFMSIMNYAESYFHGEGNVFHLVQFFEYRPMETVADIYNLVSVGGDALLLKGRSIVDALLTILPTQIRPYQHEPLSIWYMRELYPDAYENGFAAAFSIVAEGYLNYKISGVLIAALLLGFVAAEIDRRKFNFSFPVKLLIAMWAPGLFKAYRVDTIYIVHSFFWSFVVISSLYIFVRVLRSRSNES